MPDLIPFLDLGAQYRELKSEIDAAIARVMESSQFILGKETGKDLPRAVGLSVMQWAPAISFCHTANVSAFGQRRREALVLSYVPSSTSAQSA